MTKTIHPELITVFMSAYEQVRHLFQKKLRDQGLDLGPSDYHSLRLISLQPGLNQQDLGRFMGKDKALITRKIRSLEKEGLVLRQRNPFDQRSYQLFLTERGLQLWKRIDDAMSSSHAQIFSTLSLQQQTQLFELLQHCLDQVNK